MSSRMHRFLGVAAIVLILLLSVVAISRGQEPNAAAAAPPAESIVTSSGVFEIPSGEITVTDTGVLPANITVTVGAQVFWVNNTAAPIRVSNAPIQDMLEGGQVYLPLVTRSDRQIAAGDTADSHQPVQPTTNGWISGPIAPGSQYGLGFTEVGQFSYYTDHLDGIVGVVTVVSDTLVSTVYVEAARGGVIQAGVSKLDIPPGALAQDTVISVGEPISGVTIIEDGMLMILLEPSGLSFSQPATLTIQYGVTGQYAEELLRVVAYNERTGEWGPQQILAQDRQQNTVIVKTEHFSSRLAWVSDPLYLIMELPAKFLKPGYVLVRMDGHYDSTKPNNGCNGTAVWFPGHTGIYSETIDSPDSVDTQGKVIEANRFVAGIDGGLNCTKSNESGVRELSYTEFVTSSCGFFMGAMHNSNATTAQAQTARDNAAQKIGSGYLAIGQGNLLRDVVGYECYSCVGLVEDAYDRAGADITPWWEEGLFITPVQQYRKLHPVDEISIHIGEQVRIPVKAIHQVAVDWSLGQPWALDHYELGNSVSSTLLPSGSIFSDGVFEWTPQASDGDKSYTVQFDAQATVGGKQYSVLQTLTIHVLPSSPDLTEEILILAGTFQMGCDSSNWEENFCTANAWQVYEQPLHTVFLNAYVIDRYEVTNARYQSCVDAGGCTAPQSLGSHTRASYYGNPTYADYPVINVTWQQATAFCAWAGKRLPTEAEWERASRGSIDTRKYPWGDSAPACAKANYWGQTGGCVGDTSRVGSYVSGASPDAVMDMAGNVWEWVNDWYMAGYYEISPGSNPQGPATGTHRVMRGGSWDFEGDFLRSAFRSGGVPANWSGYVGFRCARSH